MKLRTSLLLPGVLALCLVGAGISRVALGQGASAPTSATTYTVIAGWGDGSQVANIFTPQTQEIYVGDKVTWKVGGSEEPHTVTFGPPALLDQLATNLTPVQPQKAGPPIISLNPKVAFPTTSPTYDGTGYANSGFLNAKGKTWSLIFTKPGTYRYFCLIHYTPGHAKVAMSGTVIVHARPAEGHMYFVSTGSKYDVDTSATDSFNPRHLTVHVGDSVSWCCGFHTVTFGPDALRKQLEKTFIVPMPQKSGPPMLTINPKVALPSGNPKAYDGTGFLNSGLLIPQGPNAQPQPFTVTFTKPGTFEYDCLVHYGMDGTITVLP